MIPKKLIRGTTPTFRVIFKKVDMNDIKETILGLTQNDIPIVQKDITEASIDYENKAIEWTLTQEESLSFNTSRVVIASVDWLLEDGTRGRSKEAIYNVEQPATRGVIE